MDYRTALEVLTGNTPDISHFLDFEFYQWIKFFDPTAFPESREVLSRWPGHAHGVGQAQCYYVLKENGQVITSATVRSLSPEEMMNDSEIKAREEFDKNIVTKVGSFDDEYIHFQANDEPEEAMTPDNTSTHEDNTPNAESNSKTKEADTPDVAHGPDPVLNATVVLPRGDQAEVATVKCRKRNNDGNLIGRKHKIPTLDSHIYVCEFPDGETCDVNNIRFFHEDRSSPTK